MLNLLVAPAKVNHKAEVVIKKVVKLLKAENTEYSVYFSHNNDELCKIAEELVQMNETDIVVVGGNVAVHTVLNAIKDVGKIKLGIIPTGEDDDFVKFMQLETNPVKAIKNILNSKPQAVDYLTANNTIVLNNIMVGASAEVAEAYCNYNLKGALPNLVATLKHGKNFNGIELLLDTKTGKPKKELIFDMSICNTGISAGKNVSPLSNPNDGLLNLTYAKFLERPERAKYLLSAKKGKHIYAQHTKQQWLKAVRLTNEAKSIKAVLDGSVYTFDELNISVVEKGLKIYK